MQHERPVGYRGPGVTPGWKLPVVPADDSEERRKFLDDLEPEARVAARYLHRGLCHNMSGCSSAAKVLAANYLHTHGRPAGRGQYGYHPSQEFTEATPSPPPPPKPIAGGAGAAQQPALAVQGRQPAGTAAGTPAATPVPLSPPPHPPTAAGPPRVPEWHGFVHCESCRGTGLVPDQLRVPQPAMAEREVLPTGQAAAQQPPPGGRSAAPSGPPPGVFYRQAEDQGLPPVQAGPPLAQVPQPAFLVPAAPGSSGDPGIRPEQECQEQGKRAATGNRWRRSAAWEEAEICD
jgi:hypothetical protein